ncbi:NHLP leader peptide family RiPP precursor [uncultured Tenacibaculum sp.]|uniref:NHLP leader peptide family RiPP precursor n=1 Tax=uncultured Tenacibaculum sp. TaxID=174713 RepID=UPI002636D772|nr:NHLP leader peptide family RiPP precursor [uncultured Tenacibaculum sp.]
MELTKGQKLFKDVIEKAWDDKEFKKALLNNPQEAIKQAFGQDLKLGSNKIVFNDQTDESITYINIPAKLNFDDVELNENDLEKVAGGSWPWFGPGNLFSIFNPFEKEEIDENGFVKGSYREA